MGRANRKGNVAAEKREHWTDQHPDSRHWTPHQRALARMMTEAAYNGLYGRGPAEEAQKVQIYGRSDFISGASSSVVESIAKGEWQSFQIRSFLQKAVESGEVSVRRFRKDDPFVEALWRRELENTKKALQKMGASEAASFLNDREWDIKDVWSDVLGDRLAEAASEIDSSKLAFSLQRMMLDGTLAELFVDRGDLSPYEQAREIQISILQSLAAWSEEKGFDRYVEETLLPALAESGDVLGSDPLRGHTETIERVLHAALASLRERADSVENFMDNLDRAGLFRGARKRSDCYRTLAGQVASLYEHRQKRSPDDPESWGEFDEGTEELMENIVVHSATGLLNKDANLLRNFMKSSLGEEVQEELKRTDPDYVGQITSSHVGWIAAGFDGEIYKLLRRGDINALEAWMRARKNALARSI